MIEGTRREEGRRRGGNKRRDTEADISRYKRCGRAYKQKLAEVSSEGQGGGRQKELKEKDKKKGRKGVRK